MRLGAHGWGFTPGAQDLPHVDPGYWFEGSRKMSCKAKFPPQERPGIGGWERVG